MNSTPYNPLEKANLARSIEAELLRRPPEPLAGGGDIAGAGVYAIYYSGPFDSYAPIRSDPDSGQFDRPIYVGKAIPKGGRKGGLTKDAGSGTSLRDRLRQHASSVEEARNIALADFWVRHLVVDDIWIPLGENVLIEAYRPVWNRALDGFGNKDPGRRRATQYRSPWDVLHPGRAFAEKLADGGMTADFLVERLADYFAGRSLKPLPRHMEKQIEQDTADDEDAADDASINGPPPRAKLGEE